jgi:hypothetical protein
MIISRAVLNYERGRKLYLHKIPRWSENYTMERKAYMVERWLEVENAVYVEKTSRAVYWTRLPCRPSIGKIAQISTARLGYGWSGSMENLICKGVGYGGGYSSSDALGWYADRRDRFLWARKGHSNFSGWFSLPRRNMP